MDGFTYTNIFDTKGIEYLIIIAFLLLVIPVWMIISRPMAVRSRVKEAAGVLSERILRVPQGLFFSRYHTWAFLRSAGSARIGADDLLAHLTGEVRIETLRKPGEQVKKGEPFAKMVKGNRQLELTSPITGELTAINNSLMKDPGGVRRDPYETGWICEVKPGKWKEETGGYFLAGEANAWIKKELERVREFILNAASLSSHLQPAATVLQEGGELSDDPLADMPPEVWRDFQADFLQ